jgi:hypothetical protein
MNPLSRLLAGLLAVFALAGAIFFGVFVLALAVGVGLIAWAGLWLRMLWIRRKLSGAGSDPPGSGGGGPYAGSAQHQRGGDVINAEYTVVSREEDQNH